MKKCTIENLTILALGLIALYLILGVMCCGCAGPTPSQRILIDQMIENSATINRIVPGMVPDDNPNKELLKMFLQENADAAADLKADLNGEKVDE